MANERKDCWKEEEDVLLAETVLNHIRGGSTQLKAFEETAHRLDRTPAACGFRWNSEIRKRYEEEIRQAKIERKRQQRMKTTGHINVTLEVNTTPENTAAPHPLQKVIEEISSYIRNERNVPAPADREELLQLKSRLEEKDRIIEDLRRQLNEAKEAQVAVTEDYKTLLKILERARQIGALNLNSENERASFRMDANGNLERIS